jgi:integrase
MMARSLNRLSAKKAEKLTRPGRHADGGGLYLAISGDGSRRRWVFLYRTAGRLREMGLGSARAITLADARDMASGARAALRNGRDPLADREAARAIPTFGEMAEEVIASLENGWKNPKHRKQWRSTVTDHCKAIRSVPVNAITTEHILAVLKPLWERVPETASRLRGRIEVVLDAAKAKGLRTGENPARWRGNLNHLLPKRQKLTRGHHKALPYRDVPAFIARLRESGSMAALCLEFTILTAARSGEALGARWDEINLDRRLWTMPASRMKGGRPHEVPLAERAVAIINTMRLIGREGEYVFAGQRPGRHLSGMAMEMVMRRMKVPATVHGFRSAFRDWAAEETDFPSEVVEMALAHTIRNAVERAYRRGNLLEKRRALMDAWARYCEPRPAEVVRIEDRRSAA